MADWKTIDTAPDDFDRPGGQRQWRVRDREGKEFVGQRGIFNNSGWREVGSNREIWPTHWLDDGSSPDQKTETT